MHRPRRRPRPLAAGVERLRTLGQPGTLGVSMTYAAPSAGITSLQAHRVTRGWYPCCPPMRRVERPAFQPTRFRPCRARPERRAFQLPGIRLLGRRFERRAFQPTRLSSLPRPFERPVFRRPVARAALPAWDNSGPPEYQSPLTLWLQAAYVMEMIGRGCRGLRDRECRYRAQEAHHLPQTVRSWDRGGHGTRGRPSVRPLVVPDRRSAYG